jgi:hypothetical protein
MSAPTREELLARMDGIGAGIDALKRENAELRAALDTIRKGGGGLNPLGRMEMARIARDALADRVVKSAGGAR